jgi:hypothetical protein
MTTNPNVAERTPVLPARLTDVADGTEAASPLTVAPGRA